MIQLTSNKWQDRDNEIITEKALSDYVESMWTGDKLTGKQKQVFWHMNPDKYPIGNLAWAGMIKGFLVEVFEEEDNILAEKIYDAVENSPKGWGSSHGFKYSEKGKDGKVYRSIRKFESTVIPREHAANAVTLSRVLKGSSNMARSKALDVMLGVENAESLLEKGFEELAKAMNAAGIPSRKKEYTGHKAEGEPPAEDDQPQSAEPTANEMEAARAKLMKEMIEGMGSLEKRFGEYKAMFEAQNAKQVATEKAYKETTDAQATVITDLQTRIKALEAAVAIKPRSAIGNEASAEIGATLKDKLPASATELDPMFKELGVLKK